MTKRFLSILMIIAIVLLLIPVTPAEAQTVVSKTEEEVRAWLDNQVGRKVNNLDDDLYASYLSFWGLDWNAFENPPHITCPPGFVEIIINGNAENLRMGDIIVPEVYWRGGEPINIFAGKDRFGNDQYIRTYYENPGTYIEKVTNELPQHINLCYRPTNIVYSQQKPRPLQNRWMEAYLRLLTEKKQLIRLYSWQKGYHNDNHIHEELTDKTLPRPVVICDICGDATPELIYIEGKNTSPYMTSSLKIFTFKNGSLRELYSGDWDEEYSNEADYYFFQIMGSKDLYYYYGLGPDWPFRTWKRFEEKPGELLEPVVVYELSSCYDHVDENGFEVFIDTYKSGDEVIGKQEYEEGINRLENNTENVLMYNSRKQFVSDFIDLHGCQAATCDEAMVCLERIIDEHIIMSDLNDNRDFIFNENETVEQLVTSTSASQYNPRLANFLAVMARSVYTEDLVKLNYEKLGINISFNNSFGFENAEAAYVVGKKQLEGGRYIVFVTIRGSYGLSWLTDFAPGTALNFGGWHDGFELCCNILHDNIKQSFGGKIPTNARYVITGHSLGAAVGNLLATKLNEDGVPMNFVYAYNFACPDVANDWDWAWNHNGEHNNIFNIGCCQDPVTFVPGALFDFVSWPWLFWGKYGQSAWFSENWNNLDKLMLNPSSHDMKTYVDYLSQEKPFSEFRSYSEVYTSIIGNQLRTILGIMCPVDVKVRSSSGDLLLSITGDKVEYFGIDPEEVIVCFNGDEKCIVLPSTDDVIVELFATDNGVMTYTAAKVNMSTHEALDSTRYSNVPLAAGKTFLSTISGDEDSSDTTLFITDADGQIIGSIEPDENIDLSDTSEPLVQPTDEDVFNSASPDNRDSAETGSNRMVFIILTSAVIAIVGLGIIALIRMRSSDGSRPASK